jgi:hypothetical protein
MGYWAVDCYIVSTLKKNLLNGIGKKIASAFAFEVSSVHFLKEGKQIWRVKHFGFNFWQQAILQ